MNHESWARRPDDYNTRTVQLDTEVPCSSRSRMEHVDGGDPSCHSEARRGKQKSQVLNLHDKELLLVLSDGDGMEMSASI